MPQLFSTSRAEASIVRFPPLFFPIVVVLALVLQTYLPVVVHAAVYLDLPLLIVIYWAASHRRAGGAAALGAVLGLLQDSLSHLALGVNGIAKTFIGYATASLGGRLDADHPGIRLVVVVVCYEANRAMVYALERFLMGTPVPWRVGVTTAAAAVNGVLALLLYRGFDRFRQWV
ncbi:MAG: rod shape-determining protein MreD [Terriglobales bacterium]